MRRNAREVDKMREVGEIGGDRCSQGSFVGGRQKGRGVACNGVRGRAGQGQEKGRG